jgi:hypothetical protein
MGWTRVTKQFPCPVCGKDDYCSVSEDGAIGHCMREPSDWPCRSAKIGGWFHKLSELTVPRPAPKPKPEEKPVRAEDFEPLADECRVRVTRDMVEWLSTDLGLSTLALDVLYVGWHAKYLAYTFPMRDAERRIIGLQVRARDGKKWSVPGSSGGLFWPAGIDVAAANMLLLPEGASSCGACYDLGYDCIGRFNCDGRIDLIAEVVSKCRQDALIVLVADNDEEHLRLDGTTYYPGQDGARKVAEAILPKRRRLKIIKPPRHKDMRVWLLDGATRAAVDMVIKNTRFA